MPKITFLGAGSTVFAKNLLGDLLSFPELAGSTIVLEDIDEEHLKTTEIVANKVAQAVNANPIIISTTTSRTTALAAAAGYPVGDVRAPITTFESLGDEGRARVAKMVPLMEELDRIVDRIEGRQAAAE